jgi:hypothetical protein
LTSSPDLTPIQDSGHRSARHAIVLSVDQKSQIQALDRTKPSLPMKKGRALFANSGNAA